MHDQTSCPWCLLHRETATWYPLNRRLGRSQGRSGVSNRRKISYPLTNRTPDSVLMHAVAVGTRITELSKSKHEYNPVLLVTHFLFITGFVQSFRIGSCVLRIEWFINKRASVFRLELRGVTSDGAQARKWFASCCWWNDAVVASLAYCILIHGQNGGGETALVLPAIWL